MSGGIVFGMTYSLLLNHKQWRSLPMKNLCSRIRSAIVSAFDRLLFWTIRKRGYDVVNPDAFLLMASSMQDMDGYIRKSDALCTSTGKIPRAKKKLLRKIGVSLMYAKYAANVQP